MAQIKENGAWSFYGTYKDIQGNNHRYHKRGYSTKKEAKEAEHAFRLSVESSLPSITLDELVNLYHENFPALGVKEATLYSNESYYRMHIKPYLGTVQIKKINAPMISKWMIQLSKIKRADGKSYSTATINKSKDTLSKYLAFAMQLGYIEYNPCHSVPRFKNPETIKKEDPNFWELSEFNTFINSVDDPYWHDVFTFMFETGVREGELFALQWKDIDFKKGTCHIYKTVTNKTAAHTYKITSPKTGNSNRTIDLQDSLITMLENRYKCEKKKDGYSPDYFVFGDIAPLSRSKLAAHLDYYIKKSGVKRITPHGFRHSHASFLIRSGMIDDQLIADRLGHTVEEMRKTYAHIYAESRNDLKATLNKIYEKKYTKNTPAKIKKA